MVAKSKLKWWVILLSFLLWFGSGWISPARAANAPANPKVVHVLNRLGFGASPGDIERVEAMGVQAYIESQLHPEAIAEPPEFKQKLRKLQTWQMNPQELFEYVTDGSKGRQILQEATQARLLHAIESPRQLQEVMADFWYNHFNVFAHVGTTRRWVGAYEREAIRPHALGRFRDLLAATAKHPAMLLYLDNWLNTAPESPGAMGRFKGLNENYARELMELHTLGVDGGYTQEDVEVLARILTGWGFALENGQQRPAKGRFYFDRDRHDFSAKTFLGKSIPSGGIKQGEKALDLLASHPATARHISYKLAQYFVTDNPPNSLVDRLSDRFLETDGNIRAVLDTLFHSGEFWNREYYDAKFKTPNRFVISAIRATGQRPLRLKRIGGIIRKLGMPIYGCRLPNGYDNIEPAWLNPDAMIRRVSVAAVIARGHFTNRQRVDATALQDTLGRRFSEQTQKAIASSPRPLRAGLLLGSPEFMRY